MEQGRSSAIGIKKAAAELERYIGRAARAYEDEHLEQVRIVGGQASRWLLSWWGRPPLRWSVNGAHAKDAASSTQAAVRGGYVPEVVP